MQVDLDLENSSEAYKCRPIVGPGSFPQTFVFFCTCIKKPAEVELATSQVSPTQACGHDHTSHEQDNT